MRPFPSRRRTAATPSLRAFGRAGTAVVRHPSLWVTALRQVRVLAVPGWWHRSPFLPLPDAAYLRFRLETAYGDGGLVPDADDVVTYLRWCRAWPHVAA